MLKKLLSETVIYGGSTILTRLINYALVPLHTTVLATDSYGIVSYFYSYAAILNVIFMYGMETAYFRFVSKQESDSRSIYNAALTSILLSSFVFSGFIILFSQPIATALGYPDSQHYIIWFALLIGIDAIVAIPFAQLRVEHRPVKFASLKLMNVFMNLGLNVFFLVLCKDIHEGKYLISFKEMIDSFYDPNLGLGYAFLSNLIANALFLPLLWQSFYKWKFQFSTQVLRPMYQYAFPLVLSGLAYTINEVFDRIVLKYWLPIDFYQQEGWNSMDAIGVYAGCYKLSIFITLAIQGFRYAGEPFFFAQANNQNSPQLFAKVMKYFIIVCTTMMVAVSVNVDILSYYFLGQADYRLGIGVVPFLLLANIFLGIYYNLAVWFKLTDKTHFGAIISSIGAFITLSLNFLLIPILGFYGSSIATLVCYASMTVISYFLGKKHYPVPYQIGSALFYIITASLCVFIAFQVRQENGLWNLITQNIFLFFFLFLIFIKERNEIENLLNLRRQGK